MTEEGKGLQLAQYAGMACDIIRDTTHSDMGQEEALLYCTLKDLCQPYSLPDSLKCHYSHRPAIAPLRSHLLQLLLYHRTTTIKVPVLRDDSQLTQPLPGDQRCTLWRASFGCGV